MRAAALVWLSVSIGASWSAPALAAPAPAPLPFASGDTLADYSVVRVEREPEFVRFFFVSGDSGRTTLEVTWSRGPDDPWSTRAYRIQPAPGARAPAALLRTVLERLRSWEARPEHRAFVQRKGPDADAAAELTGVIRPNVPRPPPGGALALGLLGLNALLLLGALCLGLLWARRYRTPPVAELVTVLTLGSGAIMAVLLTSPEGLPPEWATALHEGLSRRTITHLHGIGANVGSNHAVLVDAFTGPSHATRLLWIAQLHLCVGLAAASTTWLVARAIVGGWFLPLGLTLAFAFNPVAVNGAVSEQPSMFLALYALLATVGAGGLARREALGTRAATLGTALVVVAAALAALTRIETAALGAPMAGAAILVRLAGAERCQTWLAKLGRPLGRLFKRRPVAIVAGLAFVAFVVVGIVEPTALEVQGLEHPLDWAVDGLNPLNPSIVTLPEVAWRYLPLALVLLVLIGLVVTARALVATLALPFGVVVLYRVYFSASHEVDYEMLRYFAILLVPVFVVACFGARWLRAWVASLAERPGARRAAVAVAVAGWLIPSPMTLDWLAGTHGTPETPGLAGRLALGGNQQTEARHLLRLLTASPECTFVARTSTIAHHEGPIERWTWVFFGAGLPEPVWREDSHDDPVHPIALARQLAGGDSGAGGDRCVRRYYSLDCNLQAGDGCAADLGGARRVDWLTYPTRPYVCDYEYGAHRSPVGIGLLEDLTPR